VIAISTVALNECFQVVAPYFNALIYWNSVAFQFLAVRWFHEIGKMEFFAYGMCCLLGPSVWVLLMTFVLEISKMSTKALNAWKNISWENPQVALYMKKSHKFWRPFRFYFGNLYIMKPIRLIIFFHAMIWGVSKALFFIKTDLLNQ